MIADYDNSSIRVKPAPRISVEVLAVDFRQTDRFLGLRSLSSAEVW